MKPDRSIQIAAGNQAPQEAVPKPGPMKDTSVPDLSHVFGVGADEGQDAHGTVPHEVWHHWIAAFAHHAKPDKHPHPGKYQGPAVPAPDWHTPEDAESQQQEQQSHALENIASGSPPVIPSAPKQPMSKAGPKPPQAPTYDPSQAPGNTVPS